MSQPLEGEHPTLLTLGRPLAPSHPVRSSACTQEGAVARGSQVPAIRLDTKELSGFANSGSRSTAKDYTKASHAGVGVKFAMQ